MTSIGKILVLIITILNVFLLAISAAALATRTDWKTKLADLGSESKAIQDATDRIQKDAALRQASVNDYESKRQSQETTYLKSKIEPLVQETSKLLKDNAEARKTVLELRNTTNAALKTSDELASQVMVLRQKIASFEEQKAAFDRQNQELEDKIWNLRRQIGVAKTHRGDLGGGDRVAAFPRAR